MFKNIFSNTIHQNRPKDPDPIQVGFEKNSGLNTVTPNLSPRWQRSAKIVVIVVLLVLAGISIYLLNAMIVPMMLAFLTTYLLQPLAKWICRKTHMSWQATVIILFLLILVLVIGSITWGGISIFSQTDNLLKFLNRSIDRLPDLINEYRTTLDPENPLSMYILQYYDIQFSEELSQNVQGMIQNFGSGLSGFAQGAASKIGWFFFILGFAFFMLLEAKHVTTPSSIEFPFEGYEFDFLMFRTQISRIWNGFLRGQLLLMVLTFAFFSIFFTILGLQYSFPLAVLASVLNLIPYLGSFVTLGAYGLVAYFQGSTIFGMSALFYMLLIVSLCFLLDKFKDGFVQPKLMAEALKIHPALVLFFAIACSRVIGVMGFIIAAPIAATIKLFLLYVIRKLNDKDPWESMDTITPPLPLKESLFNFWFAFRKKFAQLRTLCNNFFLIHLRRTQHFIGKIKKKFGEKISAKKNAKKEK